MGSKNIFRVVFMIMLLAVLSGCNGQKSGEINGGDNIANIASDGNADDSEMDIGIEDENGNGQEVFCVSDFIQEPDDNITRAMGGRAYILEAIPAFPDATSHFAPSTEDYCLMCYPATVYRDTIDSVAKIAKFDLISWDASGVVDTHYQAFVFDSAEEAEKYHEFRKERDSVKYRELYAGSNLSDPMMTGCAIRYDNIIYFNMGFETVGMEDAYGKTYLTDEQSFYEGIGYSFMYSAWEGEYDSYSHYVWTEDDNEYFYPVSHRFTVSKSYNTIDLDGIFGSHGEGCIEYILHDYDEYGNGFRTISKLEVLDEKKTDDFLGACQNTFADDDNVICFSVGCNIYIYNDTSTAENQSITYGDFLGSEYMERDTDYDEGQFPEMGMGRYYYFSCRDKEYPTQVSDSRIVQNVPIVEPKPQDTTRTDDQGTGSWEAYFCSEEIDTVLSKPSCEMFVGKDGAQTIIHIYEYQEGILRYESIATGDYEEIITPEQVSVLEADNLTDEVEEVIEYVLTAVDRDTLVFSVDAGELVLDYLLLRAEHTIQ